VGSDLQLSPEAQGALMGCDAPYGSGIDVEHRGGASLASNVRWTAVANRGHARRDRCLSFTPPLAEVCT
jgi:hypothetical protein